MTLIDEDAYHASFDGNWIIPGGTKVSIDEGNAIKRLRTTVIQITTNTTCIAPYLELFYRGRLVQSPWGGYGHQVTEMDSKVNEIKFRYRLCKNKLSPCYGKQLFKHKPHGSKPKPCMVVAYDIGEDTKIKLVLPDRNCKYHLEKSVLHQYPFHQYDRYD